MKRKRRGRRTGKSLTVFVLVIEIQLSHCRMMNGIVLSAILVSCDRTAGPPRPQSAGRRGRTTVNEGGCTDTQTN